MKIRIHQIAITFSLIALMTFLFFKTNAVETIKHNQYHNDLRQIKELGATVDREILEQRYGISNSYDLLMAETRQLEQLEAGIRNVPGFVSEDGQREIDAEIDSYLAMRVNEAQFIESFKSRNAIINNSLRYFPVSAASLIKDLSANPREKEQAEMLNTMLRDTLTYYLSADGQVLEEINSQIQTLRKNEEINSNPARKNNLDITISHAVTILKLKPEIDDLVKQSVQIATGEKIEEIIKLYEKYYTAAEASSDYYRLFLYGFTIFLLFYVGFIIFRLRRATTELNAANESLEQRVEDRTGELVAANAELTEQMVYRYNMEVEVRASEERYRALVDNGKGLICTHDAAGVLLSVNPAAAASLGYESAEMVGRNLAEFLDPPVRTMFAGYLEHVLKVPKVDGLLHLRNKAGDERTWSFSNTNIADRGEASYVLGYAQDVTESNRAAEELRMQTQRLSLATQFGEIGVWDWDLSSNKVNWDRRMFEMYGIEESVHINYELWRASVHCDDLSAAEARLQHSISGKSDQSGEFRIVLSDGTIKHIHTSQGVVINQNGSVARLIGLNVDITERKAMEAELGRARDAALESARLKSEFLANMSHEIRTPMNGVIGMTGLLLDSELDPQQRDFAETIRSSGEALLTIINDILDFSKTEAGKMQFDVVDFDLRNVVEGTVESLAEKAREKEIEFASLVHNEVPTMLRGDPGRLRQILTNLTGNSLKFTEKGEVIVRAEKISENIDSAMIRFSVRDTGIGISEEAQKRLFEAFTQADGSTTRKYGGTGLGLSISKQLVALMGGEIGVESVPGEGSTFWFTAHFEKQPAREESDPVEMKDLRGLRVLIVDDNATNRTIMTHQVSSWGMTSVEADSGAAALSVMQEAVADGKPFDLVLLDLFMPGMDGFALARSIKQNRLTRSTRLVLLSSGGNRGDAIKARETGIAAYLTKPVKQSQLFDCLVTVMSAPAETDEGRSADTGASPLVTKHSIMEARPMSNKLVLIAEDNLVNQKVASHQLLKLGYRSDVVANGLEAIEALGRIRYDVVLMDCQMPEMDGFAATAEIRRIEGDERHTPIIAMTANALTGDDTKCLDAGMDDYLSKPVKPEILHQKLLYWFARTEGGQLVDGSEPAAVSVINKDTLSALRELQQPGDPDFVTELIDLYLESGTEQMGLLRSALDGRNAGEVKRIAHQIKGSSGNIGAEQIADICQEMEKVWADEMSTPADPWTLFTTLEDEMKLAVEELNKERREVAVMI